MRKHLIILNYQREIPPFMLSQIKYAAQQYGDVFYVTRDLVNDNSKACDVKNLTVVQAGCARRGMGGIQAAGGALLHGGARCFLSASHKQRINPTFIRTQLKYEAGSYLLYRAALPLISRLGQDNCTVLSAWFMSEAYAAYLLKRRFPGIQTVSFAHSFEVQKFRDSDLDLRHIIERHSGIDKILFISRTVLEQYKNEYMLPLGLSTANTGVYYLGSEPNQREEKGYSKDGVFRLVSCSGISQVKRLNLLIEALSEIDNVHAGRLSWTHIGSGPDEDEIKQFAQSRLQHLDFHFVGYMPNKLVHRYYEEHPCDLFINVSSMEGLPVSLMESISYGIPAIATNVGGTGEVVIDGLTGLLLSPNPTPEEVRNALVRFMDMPLSERKLFASNCKRIWSERFNASKNASSLYGFLRTSNVPED